MLASMLPGVREVRAPLIAGYLWLLGLWIAFEPLVRGRHDGSELFATLGRLGDLMSPAVLGVVVSVAAYLVGSLADSGLQSLRRRIMRDYVMGSIASPDDGPSIKAVASLEIIGDEQIEEVRRRLGEAELDVSDLPDELFGDAETHFVDEADRSPERLGQELERSIMEELPLIATRLITESPELFATVDRLRAEAQLRFAVGLSLPVVLVAATFRSSAWWLLGLLLTAPLLLQAHHRSKEANDVLIDAVLIGKVEPPAVERLRRAVDHVIGSSASESSPSDAVAPPVSSTDAGQAATANASDKTSAASLRGTEWT